MTSWLFLRVHKNDHWSIFLLKILKKERRKEFETEFCLKGF